MEFLPAIDLLDGQAVRLAKGDYNQVTVYNTDPVAQARVFEASGARWLHVVDLEGARTGEPAHLEIIERIARETSLHIEVGGGVRSIETFKRLCEAGASRIVLGTTLITDEAFAQAALAYAPDVVTAGIDARDGMVAISGWREGSRVASEELIREVSSWGVTHLVYTDIAKDGMQTGIDAAAYQHIAQVFGHAVIASGGVASISDVEALAEVSDAIEGVIAGRAVYEGALDVASALEICSMANTKETSC